MSFMNNLPHFTTKMKLTQLTIVVKYGYLLAVSYPSSRIRVIVVKLRAAQLVSIFYEPESSLLFSQVAATDSHPEPEESSQPISHAFP